MVESICSYKFSEDEDFYALLGCDESSSVEQINAEFKLRALREHPDKNIDDNFSDETFKKLQQAKELLTNPEKRADYDKWRRSGMAISYKQWLGLGNSVKMTMHWASKPLTDPMIEPAMKPSDVKITKVGDSDMPRQGNTTNYVFGNTIWQREQGSDLLRKFRNYEI